MELFISIGIIAGIAIVIGIVGEPIYRFMNH